MLDNGFNDCTVSNTLDCNVRIVCARMRDGCKMFLIVKFVQPQALAYLCQRKTISKSDRFNNMLLESQ